MNFEARLKRLNKLLGEMNCETLLVEKPIDIFYLTGIELSSGKLFLSQKENCLIVDGRYFEQASKQTLYPVKLKEDDTFKELLIHGQIKQLGFDKHQTTYHSYLNLVELADEIKSLTSTSLELVSLESVVQQLRMTKDNEEITLLRNAARLGYQGFEYLASLLREGITEAELAFELEFFWKKRGATRLAFDSIIAFGPNSSMPHYRAGHTKLQLHSPVLIDIGVVLSHYHSDMTRVVFFGNPSPLIQEIYSIVEEAKARALEICRPGTLIGDLDRVARNWIASKNYDNYFTHSLGHGLGLEIHEPPNIREKGIDKNVPLKAGMVITIEPGIYLPEIGGVRLEDTILITENGYENFTHPISS